MFAQAQGIAAAPSQFSLFLSFFFLPSEQSTQLRFDHSQAR